VNTDGIIGGSSRAVGHFQSLGSWAKSAAFSMRGPAHDGVLALRAIPDHWLSGPVTLAEVRGMALDSWERAVDAPLKVWRSYAETSIDAALDAFERAGDC
jgi:hypothetical protein